MKIRLLALAVLAVASAQAHADTVALWDYSTTPTTTKQTQSANGASFATVGGVTTSFVGGVSNQALNTSTYGAPTTTPSGTRGVQFNVDTSGYMDIVLTFAQRDSATASAWTTLQYTVDGSLWSTAKNFQMPNGGSNPSFVTGLTYDFSSISAVDNNPLFGIRLLAIFAPGTSGYVAANASTGSQFGSAGTIRYDNVLFSGTALPDVPAPIPEPHAYALMLAGLTAVGLLARRRRAN
ncbi:MAG: PEP-CTERM sorting domain-containing protein [Burkholderiales bacterium]|nr:PEP-CTERM sorting domain-containing protein [Burkholderiales bacterium]